MKNTDIKKVINDFIEFVDVGSKINDGCDKELMYFLDSLGLSLSHVKYQFDNKDYPEPPFDDKKSIRERISRNFSDYGFYNCVEEIDEKISETNILVGDAIDDLVDIYGELTEVCWRWENTSIADALFHFENMYSSHWGSHLRNLQLYVFNKQYGV